MKLIDEQILLAKKLAEETGHRIGIFRSPDVEMEDYKIDLMTMEDTYLPYGWDRIAVITPIPNGVQIEEAIC